MIKLVFREEVRKKISSSFTKAKNLNEFLEISQSVLNTHAPLKHKYVSTSEALFMNKEL